MASLAQVGSTDSWVSRLCVGTMLFGGQTDRNEAARIYEISRCHGVNIFDTADAYTGGLAEEILGQLVKSHRDEVVLISKVFFREGNIGAGSLERDHITQAVEKSLRRLGTDRLDFYLAHMFDAAEGIGDFVETMNFLIAQGKIVNYGVSNWAAWQIALALGEAEARSLVGIRVVEPMYNLVRRQVEVEILPLSITKNLGVFPYAPLAAGLLTGKYSGRSATTARGRIVENPKYASRYRFDEDFETAERLLLVARRVGISPVTLAVGWVMSQRGVTAPIVGARDAEQLRPSLAAMDLELDEEIIGELSGISRAPGPATDRTESRDGT